LLSALGSRENRAAWSSSPASGVRPVGVIVGDLANRQRRQFVCRPPAPGRADPEPVISRHLEAAMVGGPLITPSPGHRKLLLIEKTSAIFGLPHPPLILAEQAAAWCCSRPRKGK